MRFARSAELLDADIRERSCPSGTEAVEACAAYVDAGPEPEPDAGTVDAGTADACFDVDAGFDVDVGFDVDAAPPVAGPSCAASAGAFWLLPALIGRFRKRSRP